MCEIKIWPDEKELLMKTAGGDQKAFRVLYDRFQKKIYTYTLKILKSDLLAEETVQETFLKIWQMGSELETIQNLEGYLVTLSRNRSLDLLRRNELVLKTERQMAVDWTEIHNDTEDQILLNDTRNVLKAGIELLPQQQKLVYQLCHQEGLKYEEVAKRLNLSPLTVKTHMQLALRFLRNYLSKHTDVGILLILFKLL